MNIETDFNDTEVDALLRGFRRQAELWLLCYGDWLEYSGARIIFDRCYRPICRVWPDGRHEIVPPDTFIRYRKQRFYHSGFGLHLDPETRALVTRFITRFGLTDEFRHRRDLLRQGKLPRWDRVTPPQGGMHHAA
jgi:hypothetical protein